MERLDDLMTHGLKMIQDPQLFSFSMDAVLLAHFCSMPARGRVLDLCSGNGVIPLLLSTRTKAQITAVELQQESSELAERNVRLNQLERQIRVHCLDLKELPVPEFPIGFDRVTVNPPYLAADTGDRNMNPKLALARHEIACTLEDVIACSSRMLKYGGKVAMVHRPARLADIMLLFRKYTIEPKRVRWVHPRIGEEANLVLIEGVRNGQPEIRVLPPLVVYQEGMQYTSELLEIYNIDRSGGARHASTEKL